MSEHEPQTTIADCFVGAIIAEAVSDPAKVPKIASLMADLLADQRELKAIKDNPAPTPDANLIAAAREAVEALKIADVHLVWADCSLENVHNLVRKTADALAAALADRDRQPNERM